MLSRLSDWKRTVLLTLAAALFAASAWAESEPKPLIDLSAADAGVKLSGNGGEEEITDGDAGKVLAVTYGQEGGDWPGVNITPSQGPWDLTGYAAIEFTLTNTSDVKTRVHARADNPGDWKEQPWSINAVTLKPGQSGTLTVPFGRSYGNPGYALDPSKVSRLVIFGEKPKQAVTIHVHAIRAVGEATPASDAASGSTGTVTPEVQGETAVLLDPAVDNVVFKPSSSQITSAKEPTGMGMGLAVRIDAGDDGYPGLAIMPKDGGAWNLANFGHVEARVINTGETNLNLSMRVDGVGDWKKNPWNTESRSIKPGETGTIKVIFGYAYGYKPSYKLDPSKVPQVLLFTGKAKKPLSFNVVSIVAGGQAGETPPVNPKDVRIKPTSGVILGAGVKVDAEKQLTAKGAAAALGGGAESPKLQLTFPAGKGERTVAYKPGTGRWDLRDSLQVSVTLRNTGKAPVTPRVRVESNGGPSDWATADAPLAPGQTVVLSAPFAAAKTWLGVNDNTKSSYGQPGTGNRVTSDAVSAITIKAMDSDKPCELTVESITASMPKLQLPEWLGKRPPVEGNWVKTFEEEFDSSTIDETKWNIYGENYWDKKSHFSKDNVILGDGLVRLRFEKKFGHQNDDPNHKRATAYAAGFLDTYGKWTQRYGYFEARMKLPTAPGLWPAFWLMPDRGAELGPQWKRADTANGGMEFDIMEHLTRWGPYRYNVAMHWDGYQKNHKHMGSDKIYAQPDKDGFITSGLLWAPGLAVFYCNGEEVARWENERISSVPADMMFTIPCGGWDNNSLDDATLPDDFIIDYVRCWQLAERVNQP